MGGIISLIGGWGSKFQRRGVGRKENVKGGAYEGGRVWEEKERLKGRVG
jgi:hypothetical protein